MQGDDRQSESSGKKAEPEAARKPELSDGFETLRKAALGLPLEILPAGDPTLPAGQAAAPDEAAWEVGAELLGEYRIVRVLGRGGMGTVYEVRPLWSEEEPYAVKTISGAALPSGELQRLLLKELRIWSDLPPHPHIVGCRFFRTVRDRIAIFAELADAGSLLEKIERGELTELSEVLDIGIQIAWALQTAHDLDIVHQDVKPSNIMLTTEGAAKLTDFGVSSVGTRMAQATAPRSEQPRAARMTSCGFTPAYCAPEQEMYQQFSPQTDQWAWALSILHMCAGRVFWMHGTEGALALDDFLAESPDEHPIEAPDPLVRVLRRCLQLEPRQRYGSMQAIADELIGIYRAECGREYLRSRPVRADVHVSRRAPQAANRRWRTPRHWLEIAFQATGEPQDKLEKMLLAAESAQPQTQAIRDLELYEEARLRLACAPESGSPRLLSALAMLLFDKSFIHLETGDIPGALKLFEECNERLQQLHDLTGGWESGLERARVLMYKANTFVRLGRLLEALGTYREAAALVTHFEEAADPDEWIKGMAAIYANEAAVLAAIDDSQAVELIERNNRILEPLVCEGKHYGLALVLANGYINLSVIEWKHSASAALAHLERAETVLNEARTHLTDKRHESALALAYHNKATILNDSGSPRAAIGYFEKAQQLLDQLDLNAGRSERPDVLINNLSNHATTCAKLGQLNHAVELAGRALRISERLVRQEGRSEFTADLVRCCLKLGAFHEQLLRTSRARALIERAVRFADWWAETNPRPDNLELQAQALVRLAKSYDAAGDTAAARGACERSLAILDHHPTLTSREHSSYFFAEAMLVSARNALAGSAAENDRRAEARSLTNRALELLGQLPEPHSAHVLFQLAQALDLLAQLDANHQLRARVQASYAAALDLLQASATESTDHETAFLHAEILCAAVRSARLAGQAAPAADMLCRARQIVLNLKHSGERLDGERLLQELESLANTDR